MPDPKVMGAFFTKNLATDAQRKAFRARCADEFQRGAGAARAKAFLRSGEEGTEEAKRAEALRKEKPKLPMPNMTTTGEPGTGEGAMLVEGLKSVAEDYYRKQLETEIERRRKDVHRYCLLRSRHFGGYSS